MKIISILASILLLCISCTYLPEDLSLKSGVNFKESADYISLSPSSTPAKPTAIMFYPGGLVDPHSYISILQELAVVGYQVIIIKNVANLAIMNAGKAKKYLNQFPHIEHWLIAGHSLGAVVACMDITSSLDDYKGLILFAGYPSESNNLSNWNGAALSISAENDALSTIQEIEDAKNLLPTPVTVNNLMQMPVTTTSSQCIYHEIKGGNHGQFASYGPQKDDGIATITREEQHEETVSYIISFLNANHW